MDAAGRTLRRGRRRLPAVSPFTAARCGVRGLALQAAPATARRGGAHGARRSDRRTRTPASCRCIISSPARSRRVALRDGRRKHARRSSRSSKRQRMFARALDAGGACPTCQAGARGRPRVASRLLYRAGELRKAADAYSPRCGSPASVRCARELLLKRSKLEEKLGKYSQALRWAARAGKAIRGCSGDGRGAARQRVERLVRERPAGRKAGRRRHALGRAGDREAEAADDPEALGAACFVMGWAYGALGKEGAEPFLQRALEAYRRSGNVCARRAAVQSRRDLPMGRPLGRGAVLLRARPRRSP